ncbi:MAG: hypothetical protein NVSMB9_07770 [Isosphaeraceae bacterium]
MTTIDPEFQGMGFSGTKPCWLPTVYVRSLIYAHALAALLTAAWDIGYVAWRDGLFAEFPLTSGLLETISGWAFFTWFLFPLAILFSARRSGLSGREFRRAALATLVLSGFQFFAILPMVQ